MLIIQKFKLGRNDEPETYRDLCKLMLETGGAWVSLLLFALYRVCNSPYTLGLNLLRSCMSGQHPFFLILGQNYWLDLMTKAFFPPSKFCLRNRNNSGLTCFLSMRRHRLLCPMGSGLGDLVIITDLYSPADHSETTIQACRSRKCISRI